MKLLTIPLSIIAGIFLTLTYPETAVMIFDNFMVLVGWLVEYLKAIFKG